MALLALATFAVAAALACGTDDATPGTVAAPESTAAGTVVSPQPATPATLPVTPVSIDYTVADPAFEPLPGARALFGTYAGGAYQIEVPAAWNGDVVYFAHGFRGNPPELTISAPPIRDDLVARGYAWAASSYSRNGYEPGAGARDTYALRDVFAREVGAPRRSYLYGQSMGGHVAAFSLEQYPTAYDGALSECGVVSGHEILDYFVSWATLAGYFSGSDLRESTLDPAAFARRLRDEVLPALGPLDDPSAEGSAFANAVMHLSGGPRPFFREGYDGTFHMNFLILNDAVGRPGPANGAAGNVDTRYRLDDGLRFTTDQLNMEIARVVPGDAYTDPEVYPEFAPFTGRIERPFLTLHNTGDLLVPISLEQSYRRIVDAAGAAERLVQRAVRRPGHCNFTQEERVRAFDDMVAWAEGGAPPPGDDLRGDLMEVGRAFTVPAESGDPGGVSLPSGG